MSEIEEEGGVIYGADTNANTQLPKIDRRAGLLFETNDLTILADDDVLTALEIGQDGVLYALAA